MKRVLCILAMALLIPMLTACGGEAYVEEVDYADDYDDYADGYDYDDYDEHDDYQEYNDYNDYDEENDIGARILELAEFAAYYFDRLQAMWDADDGAMWGVRLDLPVVIGCMEFQIAAATHPDADGNFARFYFDGTVAYAGTQRMVVDLIERRHWYGETGVFIERRAMQSTRFYNMRLLSDNSTASLGLINHYAMHAIQPSLMGVSGADAVGGAGDESFVLEFNALLQALNASGEERFNAAHRALSYRNARRSTALGSAPNENLLAMSEGTAVYTELMMTVSRDEAIATVQRWPQLFYERPNNALLFGYIGGALYGILLDEFGVDWRPLVSPYLDLGELLQEALGITYFLDVELP